MQNLHVHVEDTFLATNYVNYLGYTLSSKGIKPQHTKTMSILALAEPKNKRLPVKRLIWGSTQIKAFKDICNTIARQVLLKYPDFRKPFDIQTDTSDFQLGAVISQDTWPVAFYSQKLNSAQQNYTTMEKELLSIVETSQQYRHILLGSQCNFYCDHKNLGFHNFKLERVRCWHATLEEFNYTFTYCPGKKNIIADILSQYPMIPVTTSKYEETMTLDNNCFPATSEHIKQSQVMIEGVEKK
jgi:hypothetical protein